MTTRNELLCFEGRQPSTVSNPEQVSLKLTLRPRNAQNHLPTYAPGDDLYGFVEGYSSNTLDLLNVKIELEGTKIHSMHRLDLTAIGVTRVWIPSHTRTANPKFSEHRVSMALSIQSSRPDLTIQVSQTGVPRFRQLPKHFR